MLYSPRWMRRLNESSEGRAARSSGVEPQTAPRTKSRLRRGFGYGWCEGAVIVATDPLGPESDALQTGIRLALEQPNRLVLLALVRDPSHWMHCSGVATPWSWQSVREQNIEETDSSVRPVSSSTCRLGVPVSFVGRPRTSLSGSSDQVIADDRLDASSSWLERTSSSRRMSGWGRAGIDLLRRLKGLLPGARGDA